MKSILDPSFRYTASCNTDVRKTFARAAATALLLGALSTANAQFSIDISLPGAAIGINVPSYPQLVPVPGYPVYYAPQIDANYFFYDGMYWVYRQDNWYAATWYNGPWGLVAPEVVPVFILRVPVRYYRQSPAYFRGWRADAAPHWGEHWGEAWERSHSGWNSSARATAVAAAPLPSYQRQYGGSRYPHIEQQQSFQNQYYHYQPREPVVEQHYQAARAMGTQGTGHGVARTPAVRDNGLQDRPAGGGARQDSRGAGAGTVNPSANVADSRHTVDRAPPQQQRPAAASPGQPATEHQVQRSHPGERPEPAAHQTREDARSKD